MLLPPKQIPETLPSHFPAAKNGQGTELRSTKLCCNWTALTLLNKSWWREIIQWDLITSTKQMGWQLKLHPWKLTCPNKRDHFSKEYIFQPLIFRGHVSFQGSKAQMGWHQYKYLRILARSKLGYLRHPFLMSTIEDFFRRRCFLTLKKITTRTQIPSQLLS